MAEYDDNETFVGSIPTKDTPPGTKLICVDDFNSANQLENNQIYTISSIYLPDWNKVIGPLILLKECPSYLTGFKLSRFRIA